MRLTISAVRVARWRPLDVAHVRPLPGGRWLAHCNQLMELRVLDEQLETLWRIPLPSSWVAWHGIADDLSLAALSLRDQVRLVDQTGATVASFPNPSAPMQDDQTGGC